MKDRGRQAEHQYKRLSTTLKAGIQKCEKIMKLCYKVWSAVFQSCSYQSSQQSKNLPSKN